MRTFSRKREGLARDSKGHRTGFKIYIKIRKPMSQDGWNRWGTKQKVHIGKSRFIWKHYSSTREAGYTDGIPDPQTNCATNKALGTWLITYMGLSNGETYAIHSWRNAKTKTHTALTKPLAIIEIQDVEKMSFKFNKYYRLNRYWFRKDKKKQEEIET